mgnify:CR=1 FL=1|jgi:hypothetical protein
MDQLLQEITLRVTPTSRDIVAILLLIACTLVVRWLLEFFNQRWITTFAHTTTLIVLPVITYTITKVISGNIALSLGMVGALSIVRFRNPVRSPLELSVYFGAITMGITASVSLTWLVLFMQALALCVISLVVVSYFSQILLKRPFFNASFSEGNSLSTLEIIASRAIDIIEKSELLKSKSLLNDEFKYILVSKKNLDLKEILLTVEKDSCVKSYQLNN